MQQELAIQLDVEVWDPRLVVSSISRNCLLAIVAAAGRLVCPWPLYFVPTIIAIKRNDFDYSFVSAEYVLHRRATSARTMIKSCHTAV